MTIHNFKSSKLIGDEGEQIVKELLYYEGYEIERLSVADELRYGYDFKATSIITGKTFGIEVKTDRMCEKTGNLFIETEVNGKKGWFRKYKPSSSVIIAFVYRTLVSNEYITDVLFIPVRELLTLEVEKYPLKTVLNESFYPEYTIYDAKGFVVPLKVVQDLADLYSLFR